MSIRITAALPFVCLMGLSHSLHAATVVEEHFEGYPDNALISVHPAAAARGLQGDWVLDAESDFYVNRTQLDMDAGTGKAVYDRPSDDNGARKATRATSSNHVLFDRDGDVFYASFILLPSRSAGRMTLELILSKLNGGGQQDISFGIIDGNFIVGNGGTDIDARGGAVTPVETLVLLKIENGDSSSGASDDERITLWVNPVDESSEPTINNVPVNLLNRGGGMLTAVSIRSEHMAGLPAFFDDLRVGRSMADVLNTRNIPAVSRWSLVVFLLLFAVTGMARARAQMARQSSS